MRLMPFVFIVVFLLNTIALLGQSQKPWNGKGSAVVLTYDDALNVHLDNVIPFLDSLNIKGTFYLSGYFPGFTGRVEDWKKAALNGHELANHTLFHPCIGNRPGREWVPTEYRLENYSSSRIKDEIVMTNVLLHALDGKTQRTFAYPCGDTLSGDGSYVEMLKGHFVSARGVKSEMPTVQNVNLFNVPAVMVHGQTGDQLIQMVKDAQKKGALLVFLFHGVGGEHDLNVSLQAHKDLLLYLKSNEEQIWVAPFIRVTQFVKNIRE